jgi:RNA polymerase sigma-70 factor (ECF subfamily)
MAPDERTKDELIRRFARIRSATLGYVRTLVRDHHLAEDIFQETCLVVLKKLDRYDPAHSFDGFVLGIARNLARNAMRKRKAHPMPSPELLEAVDRAFTEAPENMSDRTMTRLSFLQQCLKKLAPNQMSLVALRYRAGASLKEISRQTGRSAGAVQVALSRIRRFLWGCIEQEAETRHAFKTS